MSVLNMQDIGMTSTSSSSCLLLSPNHKTGRDKVDDQYRLFLRVRVCEREGQRECVCERESVREKERERERE